MAFTKQLNVTWTDYNDSTDIWALVPPNSLEQFKSKIHEMYDQGKTDSLYGVMLPTETPGLVMKRLFVDDAACLEWINFLNSRGGNFTYQIFDI